MNVINSNSVMAMRAAILQQNSALREAASAASAPASPVSGASAPASTDFGAAMKSALSEVNALQGQSSEATAAYERGERSEEHTSELQSLMRISYAVFCLTNKNKP